MRIVGMYPNIFTKINSFINLLDVIVIDIPKPS